jgi:hypothetical protein
MLTFLVSVNGQDICAAGVGTTGVLKVLVTSLGGASEDLLFHVGGIDGTGDHVQWTVPPIAVGDVIAIKTTDVEVVDKPTTRYPSGLSYRAFRLHHARKRAGAVVRALVGDPAGELAALRRSAGRLPARVWQRILSLRDPPQATMITVAVNHLPALAAAVPRHGNLTASLTWVGTPDRPSARTRLSVHGLDTKEGEYIDWDTPSLEVGDGVLIRVLEAQNCDPPSRVRREQPEPQPWRRPFGRGSRAG